MNTFRSSSATLAVHSKLCTGPWRCAKSRSGRTLQEHKSASFVEQHGVPYVVRDGRLLHRKRPPDVLAARRHSHSGDVDLTYVMAFIFKLIDPRIDSRDG